MLEEATPAAPAMTTAACQAEALRIGRVVRARRDELGMTQQELADELAKIAPLNRDTHVGVTANMISKWERGTKRPARLYRQLLCLVLEIEPAELGLPAGVPISGSWNPGKPTSFLGGQEPEDVDRRQFLRSTAGVGVTLMTSAALPAPHDAPQDLVAPLRRALMDDVLDTDIPDLRRLDRRIKNAWILRQQGRYKDLSRTLPSLLVDARSALSQVRGKEEAKATAILVHAYDATSSTLKTLGHPPLALVAADRAGQTSTRIDDPALTAAAGYRVANVFLPAGPPADAIDAALSAASRIEPFLSRSPIELAIWGGLMLTAAAAAASAGDAAQAWELYGEAGAAARMLGHDHADLHTIFGPTSVAMYGVSLSAELGAGRDAIRRSEQISLDRLPDHLRERRTHYLVNLASGYEQERQDFEALNLLLRAEQYSAEDVRRGALGHAVVANMLGRERRGATPGLRALADRLGVAA
jgi:transcriptional regulator with XRE-family HTH domain